jgi:hypothetical protein
MMTLLIINKPKQPKKRGNKRHKIKTHVQKKKPPKKTNHKKNIKFSNPLLSREAYQIRKGEDLFKGCLA